MSETVEQAQYPAIDVDAAFETLNAAAAALRTSAHPSVGQYVAPGLFTAEVAVRLADWFEAEAALLTSIVPFTQLVDYALQQTAGGTARLVVGTDEQGRLKMASDSSSQALLLAEAVLASARGLGIAPLAA